MKNDGAAANEDHCWFERNVNNHREWAQEDERSEGEASAIAELYSRPSSNLNIAVISKMHGEVNWCVCLPCHCKQKERQREWADSRCNWCRYLLSLLLKKIDDLHSSTECLLHAMHRSTVRRRTRQSSLSFVCREFADERFSQATSERCTYSSSVSALLAYFLIFPSNRSWIRVLADPIGGSLCHLGRRRRLGLSLRSIGHGETEMIGLIDLVIQSSSPPPLPHGYKHRLVLSLVVVDDHHPIIIITLPCAHYYYHNLPVTI